MDYDVWFIVRNGSVGFHLLTGFNWFWYTVIQCQLFIIIIIIHFYAGQLQLFT